MYRPESEAAATAGGAPDGPVSAGIFLPEGRENTRRLSARWPNPASLCFVSHDTMGLKPDFPRELSRCSENSSDSDEVKWWVFLGMLTHGLGRGDME